MARYQPPLNLSAVKNWGSTEPYYKLPAQYKAQLEGEAVSFKDVFIEDEVDSFMLDQIKDIHRLINSFGGTDSAYTMLEEIEEYIELEML